MLESKDNWVQETALFKGMDFYMDMQDHLPELKARYGERADALLKQWKCVVESNFDLYGVSAEVAVESYLDGDSWSPANSRLLQRLADGHPPLRYPPPARMYSLITEEQPVEVSEFQRSGALVMVGEGALSLLSVEDGANCKKLICSAPGWITEGVKWACYIDDDGRHFIDRISGPSTKELLALPLLEESAFHDQAV